MAETNTNTQATTDPTQTTQTTQTTQNAQETTPAPADGNDTTKQENAPQSAAQSAEKHSRRTR